MQIAVGLSFPGEVKEESIICYLCKNFNIDLKIIEASFSTSSGWAFLRIEGEEEEIKKSFDYLTGKGVQINRIDKKSDESSD